MPFATIMRMMITCALLLSGARAWAQAAEDDVEEIYVARTVRVSRVVPSDYCAPTKTGFAPALEDTLVIKSITTRAEDGRITGASDKDIAGKDITGKDIGDMHVCIGQAMDPTVLATYSEGHIAGIPYIGVGDCRLVGGNQPEQGLLTHRCWLSLSGLPEPYVGGFIVTSSLYSRSPFGTDTSPPGYHQAAFILVRLWKRRKT
jgi:hypothetical protein